MLREATLEDLEGVKALAGPWLEESGENLTFDENIFWETYAINIFDPDVHMYVLEYDNTIVGLGVMTVRNLLFQEKVAKLDWFYVHKCIRGTGAALKLAEFLRDLSIQRGAHIIIADTLFARHARVFRNMFQKLGFDQSGYTMVYRS